MTTSSQQAVGFVKIAVPTGSSSALCLYHHLHLNSYEGFPVWIRTVLRQTSMNPIALSQS